MDRGEGRTELTSGEQGFESVAADASARVGAILEEAERLGRELSREAEEAAAEARREAEAEAERIVAGAREEALAAARERGERLAELQGALASRGPALLEGLEGSGITRARLEALIEALGASAERIVREAEEGEPGDGAPPATDATDSVEEPPAPEPEPDEREESGEEEPSSSANGDGNGAVRYEGPLPEGAPMARKPMRTMERDARFAALLLAVQGRDRGDVEAHLRSKYGVADCEPILDEVFGRTPA